MRKRILSLILALSMLCAFMPCVTAAEIVASGEYGDNFTWTLDDEGTLTISGEGDMTDYSSSSSFAPWYSNRSSVISVVIENGVTSIEIVKEGSRNRIKSRFLRQYQTML